MRLMVYRRCDGALLVAPATIPPPVVPDCTGALRTVGIADIPLRLLSDELVREIALLGYAVPSDVDGALIRARAGFAHSSARVADQETGLPTL